MKTGLLFGSFNPVHIGHLAIAEYFSSRGGMDEVWMMVSPQNPFKNHEDLAPANHRLEMMRLAAASNPKIVVSDIEFALPLPSYTIDTLKHLADKFSEREFYLLMGEDLLEGLSGWKEFDQIIRDYKILVYPRKTNDKKTSPEFDFPKMDAPRLDISSTYIRENIQNGYSVRYLLPEAVISYINDHRLYQNPLL